jgi:hypothetical protein
MSNDERLACSEHGAIGKRPVKKGAHGGNMVSPVLIDAEGRTVGLF